MSAARSSFVPLLTIQLLLLAAAAGETLAQAGQRHTVKLQSQPGVEVLWEGVILGETDAGGSLIIEGIPAGEYRVTLRKQGFHTLDTRMAVAEGTSPSRALPLEPVGPRIGAGGRSEPAPPEQAENDLRESEGQRREVTVAEPVAEPVGQGSGDLSPPAGSAVAGNSTAASADRAPDRASPANGEPAETAEIAVATSGWPFSPLLGLAALLLALLAGATGARFLSRARSADALSPAPSGGAYGTPSASDELPLFEDREAPGFLEDLKQRERDFPDHPRPAAGRPEETIIEVEAVEVRPAAMRPADEP